MIREHIRTHIASTVDQIMREFALIIVSSPGITCHGYLLESRHLNETILKDTHNILFDKEILRKNIFKKSLLS